MSPDGGAEVPPAVDRAVLPDGRVLVVRPVEPADASALEELYSHLSATDTHRRFFTGAHPGRHFLDRWASIGSVGGIGLVVEEPHPPGEPGTGALVGEAGLVPVSRGDGDGELGMCVHPSWRGWLGPFLLDALLRAAARRGLEHLSADVLWENRPMIALAQARGAVVEPQPDPAHVRLRIPTGPRPGALHRPPASRPVAAPGPRPSGPRPDGEGSGEGSTRALNPAGAPP